MSNRETFQMDPSVLATDQGSSSGSFKKPIVPPVINRPPTKNTGMNVPSFSFQWEPPKTETYGSLKQSFGNFIGFLGLCPCCICCPNPYKNVEEGNVGLVTRYGKLYRGVDPGLVKVNPITEHLFKVPILIQLVEIPTQRCMTKDNVNVELSSVLYYNVIEPSKTVFGISDVQNAIVERTQTTLRHVVGAVNLQDVIEKREDIASAIEEIITDIATSWGVHIESILIKDLGLPPTVEASLSKAAEAKRIGESKIITAKAEVESAKLMRKAADILSSKAAMQIRYLDAMNSMAKSANSKVIFMPGSGTVDGMDSTNAAHGYKQLEDDYDKQNYMEKQITGTNAKEPADLTNIVAMQEI